MSPFAVSSARASWNGRSTNEDRPSSPDWPAVASLDSSTLPAKMSRLQDSTTVHPSADIRDHAKNIRNMIILDTGSPTMDACAIARDIELDRYLRSAHGRSCS